MTNTIDDIERLIRARGMEEERLPGADILSARVPTKAYKDAAGRSQLEVRIHVDAALNCLVMDAPWAFESRKAVPKAPPLR